VAKRVLIAEDVLNSLTLLAYLVQKSGYEAITAENGEEALEKAKQEKPDLILLDIMMPHRNGYEVCRELRQHPDTQNIHIMLISARAQETDQRLGFDAGANEYLTKPVSPRRLMQRLRELLG